MKILKPKYYLNKRLKPKKIGSIDTYPVYFRFTVGRSNHQVKSVLIGYLKSEIELENYRREIEVETAVLNYLFNRYQDYTFDNFNSDAFYLCSPLQVLISLYICTYVDEFEDQVALEVYTDEMRSYLLSKTEFPIPFLNTLLENINFQSLVPSEFIKDKKLKLIIDTYNSSFKYNEKESSLLCMYNWIHTDINDDFSKLYGSSHSEFIDKIIGLYSTSLNPSI